MIYSEFLSRLKAVKKSGEGHVAQCPAHKDEKSSLSVGYEEKGQKILLHCFAGCEVKDIVTALDLTLSDLFVNNGNGYSKKASTAKKPKGKITLEALAKDKQLPVSFLVSMFHLSDNGAGVVIPYLNPDNSVFRERNRTALKAKEGSFWLAGEGQTVYGLHLLNQIKASGYIIFVEGESDTWSGHFYGLPVLGIPGADGVKVISADHIEGVTRIFYIKEPDKGGETFALKINRRLKALNFKGELCEIRLPDAKDLNELHKRKPDEFLTIFKQCQSDALRIDLDAVEETISVSKSENSNKQERKTPVTLLIELTENFELFHDEESRCYATFPNNGHYQTYSLDSKAFRLYWTNLYYQRYDKTPGNFIHEALEVLKGKALFSSPQLPVFIRVASYEGSTYIDLTNERWEAIKLGSNGWQIVKNPPVKFIRRRSMKALATPERGGNIEDLWNFVNITDVGSRMLYLAWICTALRDVETYPPLVISGEQGSSKSTVSKIARMLTDPSSTLLRLPPNDVRDLVISAKNNHVLAWDNVSHIPAWLSDACCVASTGGGYATRELHTDDEEVILSVKNPILLNGIEDMVTRPDFADRSIMLHLPRLNDVNRKDEGDFWTDFEQVRPRIFGAILDAICGALRVMPCIKLHVKPRMVDFAKFGSALEQVLFWKSGSFISAYIENRQSAVEIGIEASSIALAVKQFMESGNKTHWEGTASELLANLNATQKEDVTKSKAWPKNAHGLSNKLRRLAPSLRHIGIGFDANRANTKRTIILTREIKDEREDVAI